MLRRRIAVPPLLLAAPGLSGVVYAQLETADRGILPIDSSGTLEITGIHVDVAGADAQSARYARAGGSLSGKGIKALWAKMHNGADQRSANLPGQTLDQDR